MLNDIYLHPSKCYSITEHLSFSQGVLKKPVAN